MQPPSPSHSSGQGSPYTHEYTLQPDGSFTPQSAPRMEPPPAPAGSPSAPAGYAPAGASYQPPVAPAPQQSLGYAPQPSAAYPPYPAQPAHHGAYPGQQPRAPWDVPSGFENLPWDPNNLGPRLAQSGTRFVARLMDTLLFLLLWFVAMLVGTGTAVAVGGGDIEGGTAETVFAAVYVFSFFLMPILLEWAQVALWGRSVGKMLLGLWVVRLDDGQKISAGRALLRALCYAPGHSNLVNWLLPWSITNVLWQLRDPRNQCLHDKVAKSVVISDQPNWPVTAPPAQPW